MLAGEQAKADLDLGPVRYGATLLGTHDRRASVFHPGRRAPARIGRRAATAGGLVGGAEELTPRPGQRKPCGARG
jgi:hypothetical protein